MKFDIVRNSEPGKTFRVASVMGKFDLSSNKIEERFTGEIDIDKNKKWNIGLIVGPSGSGKTTIAKELFPKVYHSDFKYKAACILDDMPKECSVEEITMAFNSVGFSSPPSWLKPYSALSNGEKMRVDLARHILSGEKMFLFDEFTSVVDRQVAQIGSFAIQKAIRKQDRQFIACTCHYDVEDWLMPDWIFNTLDMTFRTTDGQKKNRPEIKIEIFQASDKSIWKTFAKHHYLSHSHNNAASVYVMYANDNLAGFMSVLPFPHPIRKNTYKGHRTVIFPDYQGVGLSKVLRNFIATVYLDMGKTFITTTTSPALIASMKNDPHWICTRKGRTNPGKAGSPNERGSSSSNRITTSWEYKR